MICTKKEANKKFCPNKTVGIEAFCDASHCMAWVWVNGGVTRGFRTPDIPAEKIQTEEPKRPDDLSASWVWDGSIYRGNPDLSNGWREPAEEAEARHRGYCGLIRRPE